MPLFAFSAKSRSGERIDGTLDATDRRGVLTQLNRQGYIPISITESTGAPAAGAAKKPAEKARPAPPPPAAKPAPKPAPARREKTAAESGQAKPKKKWKLERRGRARMKIREVLDFFRDLNDLINSGMPLGTSLKKLSQREGNEDRNAVILALHDDIVQGSALSESLAKHPESFPSICTNLIRAGEATGQLSDAVKQIIVHYERSLEAREKIIATLTYPMIVLLVGFLVLVFCMVVVVPQFVGIFSDLGQALPGPTRFMIGLSDFISGTGGLVTAVGTVIAFILFLRWKRTDTGERAWDAFLLNAPVIKRITASAAFGRFARTLGGLLKNGVPVLRSMEIVEQTVGNRVVAAAVAEARARVKDGASLSRPLAQGGIFPSLLTDMLAVGEEAGDMPGALEHIAHRYDEELNRSLKFLTTVLEPLILLLVAGLVGFVVTAMIMPVFSMTQGMDI